MNLHRPLEVAVTFDLPQETFQDRVEDFRESVGVCSSAAQVFDEVGIESQLEIYFEVDEEGNDLIG